MYPILFEWGPLILPAWHTFYVIGAIAAYCLALFLARRHCPDVSDSFIGTLYVICYVSGYFGARLLSIFIDEPQVQGPLAVSKALFRLGPMTFYGGAILSFVCGFIYCRIKKVSASTLMDLAIPAGLLALSIGRIGCFLNGDDFGKAVPLKPGEAAPWWSVTFPNLEDAVPRYPVQLIEAFTVLILVLILTTAFVPLRRNFRAGAVGYFGIIGYANLRFFNEYYRGDLRGFVGNSLSTSQFISLLILAAAALSLPFWLKFKKMPDH